MHTDIRLFLELTWSLAFLHGCPCLLTNVSKSYLTMQAMSEISMCRIEYPLLMNTWQQAVQINQWFWRFYIVYCGLSLIENSWWGYSVKLLFIKLLFLREWKLFLQYILKSQFLIWFSVILSIFHPINVIVPPWHFKIWQGVNLRYQECTWIVMRLTKKQYIFDTIGSCLCANFQFHFRESH